MKFSMNIVKPVNILVAFHYKFYSSLGLVYKEEKVMSRIPCSISIGGILYVMKWLIPAISHSIYVVRHMPNSSEIVKWVVQFFRGTSVTYNGFNGLVCGNCNLDFAGILDRRRSTLTYVSKNIFGRHVGGGMIPKKIQSQANHTDVFTKSMLLEKL
jgi:hypothetical protein